MASHPRRITRALLSVSDKTGLTEFARTLAGYGVELVSTGGTAKALKEAGLAVSDVAELTGFPEMMDGRVKTLHPMVHGGLLAIRGNKEHAAAMEQHHIRPIDLLVVNLYPFEATVAKGAAFDDCVENIDIGGPAMIRAAAKNHADVAVVVEPADYGAVLDELAQHAGMTSLELRQKLAAKAYARTAAYDAAISNWFAERLHDEAPDYRAFGGKLIQSLRYGENPHQSAAFYRAPGERPGVASARQVQGKELSYNNINDTDAAFECVAEFDPRRTAACVIVKHANPCGVAEGESLVDAYRKALACDSTSAFGGIVALNRKLDADAAKAITEIFTEVIIAPEATEEAIKIVAAKKNLRLLLAGGLPDPRSFRLTVKSVAGGLLVQSRDNAVVDEMQLKPVTKRSAERSRAGRSSFCLPRRQAREVEHHRLCQGARHRRHRRRADEPGRRRPHRRAQGGRCRARDEARGAADQGLGGRFRCLLPVRRRAIGRDRSRRHRGDPARRLHARRRGDQGRRRSQRGDGVHRHAAFQALAASAQHIPGQARQ